MALSTRKPTGRPQVGVAVSVQLRAEAEQRLRQLADERETTLSEVLRDATRFYLRAVEAGQVQR